MANGNNKPCPALLPGTPQPAVAPGHPRTHLLQLRPLPPLLLLQALQALQGEAKLGLGLGGGALQRPAAHSLHAAVAAAAHPHGRQARPQLHHLAPQRITLPRHLRPAARGPKRMGGVSLRAGPQACSSASSAL